MDGKQNVAPAECDDDDHAWDCLLVCLQVLHLYPGIAGWVRLRI